MPRLTKTFIEAAGPGRHYDSELGGFGVFVSRDGTIRSYFVEYRAGYGRAGRKRRMVIARHGVMTAWQARTEAARLLAVVRAGGDPLNDKRASKPPGVNVASAVEQWLTTHARTRLKPRTQADYCRLMASHVVPALGNEPLAGITRSAVAKLHGSLSATPSEANHMLRALSAFFGWCERIEMRPDGSNPCRHVERYKENQRERFLSPRELARLGRALAAADRVLNPWAVAAIRLLIFTGCRMSEVLTLRWEHVDLAAGVLRLPDSKTGPKVVHLNAAARDVLAGIHRVSGNPFVIAGSRGRHFVGLHRVWSRVRKAALIEDVRLHDLRHSFASVAVSGGGTLPLIGALLGHSQPATTARYAHMYDSAQKALAEQVGSAIADAMRRAKDST